MKQYIYSYINSTIVTTDAVSGDSRSNIGLYGSGTSIFADIDTQPLGFFTSPIPGTIRNLSFELLTPPGTGRFVSLTAYKNGLPTNLSIRIEDLEQIGYSSQFITVAAGDHVQFELNNNIPDGQTRTLLNWNSEFDSLESNVSIGGFTSVGASLGVGVPVTYYCGLFVKGFQNSSGLIETDPAKVTNVVPLAGTITGYTASHYVIGSSRIDIDFVVYKNGVAQNGSGGTPDTRGSLVGDGSPAEYVTISPSFNLSVVPGDLVYVSATINAALSSTAPYSLIFVFESDTDNESIYCASPNTLPAAGTITYYPPFGSGSWASIVTNPYYALRNRVGFNLKSLYITLSAAPGSGKTQTFTLIKDYEATDYTVTIADLATTGTCLLPDMLPIPADSMLAWRYTNTGTPATGGSVYISMVQVPFVPSGGQLAPFSGIFFLDTTARHDTAIVDEAETEVIIEASFRTFLLKD